MSWVVDAANKISLEKRIDIMDRIYPAANGGNWQALEELFEIYNSYISPIGEKQNVTCSSCRGKVIAHFNQIIGSWSEFN